MVVLFVSLGFRLAVKTVLASPPSKGTTITGFPNIAPPTRNKARFTSEFAVVHNHDTGLALKVSYSVPRENPLVDFLLKPADCIC